MLVTRNTELRPEKAQRAAGTLFMGDVRNRLATPAEAQSLRMNYVAFEAGGRTKWHTHEYEQGLIILHGTGIVATEFEEYVVESGDVIFVPLGEKHWHGGTDTTAMTHISINGAGRTIELEPVESIKTKL